VGETLLRIVLYGLIAAASPLALAATLVVLRSARARLNGFIYACSFLLGEAVVLVVVITLGSIAAPGKGGSRTVGSLLELALGLLLIAAGARARRGVPDGDQSTGRRTQAVLAMLARLTPAGAFWAGTLLGIGGPKRLTVGIVAATTIAGAGLTTRQEVAVGAVYVLLASVLVWVPVALFLVAGKRSRAWLAEGDAWLMANQRLMTAVSLLVFGGLLVADALVQLLA
jgi:hypothetical protein